MSEAHYEAPILRELGTLEELTKGSTGTLADSVDQGPLSA